MNTLRNHVYLIVVATSVAMAACQPGEGPAERVNRDIDQAAKRLGDQIDRNADKPKQSLASSSH